MIIKELLKSSQNIRFMITPNIIFFFVEKSEWIHARGQNSHPILFSALDPRGGFRPITGSRLHRAFERKVLRCNTPCYTGAQEPPTDPK